MRDDTYIHVAFSGTHQAPMMGSVSFPSTCRYELKKLYVAKQLFLIIFDYQNKCQTNQAAYIWEELKMYFKIITCTPLGEGLFFPKERE